MSGDMRTIYIIRETTRYDDDYWDLGLPEDIAIEWEEFYFDTKYGDTVELKEQVPPDIERLEELLKLTGHPSLQQMIDDRKAWLKEQAEYEELEAGDGARLRSMQLEAARQLLREAGELPPLTHGTYDPDDDSTKTPERGYGEVSDDQPDPADR